SSLSNDSFIILSSFARFGKLFFELFYSLFSLASNSMYYFTGFSSFRQQVLKKIAFPNINFLFIYYYLVLFSTLFYLSLLTIFKIRIQKIF
ncbi:hypothetical protein, partial [Lactobacillus taiwanensis]